MDRLAHESAQKDTTSYMIEYTIPMRHICGCEGFTAGEERPKAARKPQGRSDDVGEQDGLAVLVCLMSVQHDTSSSQKRFQ
jgi:hypothetical protein